METLAEAMARVKDAADLRDVCEALGLEPRGKNYVCPICGSGTHSANPTADFGLYDNHRRWKCFVCGHGGDAFDLVAAVTGEQDKREQLEAVARIVGVEGLRDSLTAENGQTRPDTRTTAKQARKTPESAPKDYSEGRGRHARYIRECQERITDPRAVAYLEARGIDLDTAQAWGLGYDPQAGGAKDSEGKWCERGRIVIPFPGAPWYHVDRSTDPRAKNGKYHKPLSDEVGPQPVWNPQALAEPLFYVVEGALDALAVESAGYPAVALCSTSHAELTRKLTSAPRGSLGQIVLMFDADEPGRKAQADMAAALTAAGVSVYEADVAELGTKDAGERRELDVAHGRNDLGKFLEKQAARASAELEDKRTREFEQAMAAAGVFDPSQVAADVFQLKNATEPLHVGFTRLEAAIDGGLPGVGLVVVAALASAGKTSMCLQWADSLARDGRPVLFASIEQGREELVSKSLSRIMGGMARPDGGPIAASAAHIRSAARREQWAASDPEKMAALVEACDEYQREVAPNLYLMEAIEGITAADIRRTAERITERRGQPPVVIVDYVQLLAPPDPRMTDKASMDANVRGLRLMARQLQTCVVAISAMNRASYTKGVTLSALKESGALEYSADLALGLQPFGLADLVDETKEERQERSVNALVKEFRDANPKRCELVVLKNRAGSVPAAPVPVTFYPVTSTFKDEPVAPTRERKRVRI